MDEQNFRLLIAEAKQQDAGAVGSASDRLKIEAATGG